MMPVDEDHSPEVEEMQTLDQTANATEEFGYDTVSMLSKCRTQNAAYLYLYQVAKKFKNSTDYPIGATYEINGETEFWFYYTASKCFGNNYLLNLFLCHSKPGYFSIGISESSNNITHKISYNNIANESLLCNNLTWTSFRTAQKNETYYLKTFYFSQDDVKKLKNRTLVIPMRIIVNPKFTLNNEIVKRIKLQHDSVGLLSKQENTDFILKSASGNVYKAHKIILVAQSSVLRNLVKNSKSNTLIIDINDEDLELLLEFIYSGTLKDITKQNIFKLLEIAEKFGIAQLLSLVESIIEHQINIDNAVEMAVLARKFKLSMMLSNVYNFIQNNPSVLMTEGWKQLDDVELAKTLFHLHMKHHDRNIKM